MGFFEAACARADLLAAACVVLTLTVGLTACTASDRPAAKDRLSTAPLSAPQSHAGSTPAIAQASSSSKHAGKTVPPPVPGNIHQTVPPRKVLTRQAVSLYSVAHFDPTVAARLTSVRPIDATAHGPGEISGPALELSIRITNSGKKSADLSNVVVNVTDAAGEPGLTIAGSPADPFRGSLAAGRSTSGTYVFTVPTNHRAPVSVTVSYVATAPVALFVGNAS